MEMHLDVIAGHLRNADELLDFTDMKTRAYVSPATSCCPSCGRWTPCGSPSRWRGSAGWFR